MRKVRICITNTVALNTGDAAILYGMISFINDIFKHNEIIIFDKNAKVSQKLYPELRFEEWIYNDLKKNKSLVYKLLLKFLKFDVNYMKFRLGILFFKYRIPIYYLLLSRDLIGKVIKYYEADIIISTGGTYLVENYTLKERILDYNTSIYLNHNLMFFTQSIGEFNKPELKSKFKYIFNKSNLILVRDERSKSNLKKIEVDNNRIFVVPDAAFLLADSTYLERRLAENNNQRLPIAISVRDWRYFKTKSNEEGMNNYIQSIAKLVEYIIKNYGYRIVFISTCQGIDEYHTDDSHTAKKIVDSVDYNLNEYINIDKIFRTPIEFQDELRKYSLMIGTRMHACILALTVGVPVMPIAYEFKTKELSKYIGAENILSDIETINENDLISCFDEVMNKYSCYRKNMIKSTIELKKKAESISFKNII